MSESFRSLRPSWIAFGWFIAAALTAGILLGLTVAGILGEDAAGERVWVAVALALGFAVAGFYVGTRVNAAPILHGLGMGLFSLVVWLGLNLFLGEPTGGAAWNAIPRDAAGGLVFLLTSASVVGTRQGVRYARRHR